MWRDETDSKRTRETVVDSDDGRRLAQRINFKSYILSAFPAHFFLTSHFSLRFSQHMSKKRASEALSVDVPAPIGVDGDNQPAQSPAAKKPRVEVSAGLIRESSKKALTFPQSSDFFFSFFSLFPCARRRGKGGCLGGQRGRKVRETRCQGGYWPQKTTRRDIR